MLKRLQYEFKKSFPFFSILVIVAIICWLIMYRYFFSDRLGRDPFAVNMTMPVILVQVFLVFFSIRFVVINFSRELSSPQGILTFLTPVPGWKIMIAKWINLLLSFGLSFFIIRIFTMLLPMTEDSSLGSFLQIVGQRGLITAFFSKFLYTSPDSLISFVLFWSNFLFVGYFVLLKTKAIFIYRKSNFLMQLVRLVLIFAILISLWKALSLIFEAYPLIMDSNGNGLIFIFDYLRDGGDVYYNISSSSAYVSSNGLNEWYYSGESVIHMLGYSLSIIIFLFLSSRTWEKMDR